MSKVMPLMDRLNVGLCEGNVTLRSLIREVLSEASMNVKLMEASASLGQERVDLLVLDVDSGIGSPRIELLLKVSVASQTPVLLLGFLDSHKDGKGVLSAHSVSEGSLKYGWLQRPFSGSELVRSCRQLMGAEAEKSVPFDGDDDETSIAPSFAVGFDSDEPPTVELEADYHHLVREGLEASLDYEELLSFDIEEFGGDVKRGGVLVGEVSERLIEERELEHEINGLSEPTSLLRITSSDGILLSDTLAETSSSGVFVGEGSVNLTGGSASVVSRHRVGSGASSVSAAGLSPEVVHSIVGTARMLAESWDRLGLAARTEDRADRLERILFALFKDGLQGAAAALSRIPSASGLSGSLQVLELIDLLHVLRERGLRGRLELCVGEQVFVLYVDGGILEDIESLGGSTDSILLRILREQSAIDDETHARLSAAGDDDDGLSAPLEMRLRVEQLVDDADLRAARRLRAKELFGGLFGEQRGNYAFIEALKSGTQAWPVDGLRLNIDEMLLRLFREGQIGLDKLVFEADAGLILDPVRAASVRASALTDAERELLLFFQAGEAVADARKQFGNAGDDVEQVLARLVRIELLKPYKVDVRRLNVQRNRQSSSQVSASQAGSSQAVSHQRASEQVSRIELDFDINAVVAPVDDPHQSTTAVSDWAIPIPGVLGSEGVASDVIESINDGLWDALDAYFDHEDMSEVSSELLPDTGELDKRIFGPGEQDDES